MHGPAFAVSRLVFRRDPFLRQLAPSRDSRVAILAMILALLGLFFHPAVAAKEPRDTLPAELAHRWALFSFYQEKDLESLARFPSDPTVLSLDAQMHLHQSQARFGLEAEARRGFQRIMRDHEGNISARAAFELGKLEYLAENNNDALHAFNRINQLDKKLLPIYQRYHSAALLRSGDLNKAAKVISKMDEGVWAGYAYYNLARKYADKDSNASRPLLSLRVADALNTPSDALVFLDTQSDLQNRIFLASGKLAFEEADYEKARNFLNKILIDSSFAAEGFYLHGLSYFKAEQYRNAIQSWYRVKKYPLSQKGVSQAYAGIAYAFLKSGNKVKAIESYLENISVHEQELRTLNEMQTTIKSIGFNKAMLKKSNLDNLDTFLDESVNTNTPKAAYLNYFANNPERFKYMEDIVFSEKSIDYLQLRLNDLNIFKKMLNDRIKGFGRATQQINAGKFRQVAESAKQSITQFGNEKETAVDNEDFLSVASSQVQEQIRKVESLRKRAQSIQAKGAVSAEQYAEMVEKVHRIHGLLVWRAKEMFELNIGNLSEDLNAVQFELASLEESIQRIEEVVRKGPVGLKAKLKRVEAAISQTENLLAKNRKTLAALDKALTVASLDDLAQRQETVQTEYEVAQLTLAQLYETIAVVHMEEQEKSRVQQEGAQ